MNSRNLHKVYRKGMKPCDETEIWRKLFFLRKAGKRRRDKECKHEWPRRIDYGHIN